MLGSRSAARFVARVSACWYLPAMLNQPDRALRMPFISSETSVVSSREKSEHPKAQARTCHAER